MHAFLDMLLLTPRTQVGAITLERFPLFSVLDTMIYKDSVGLGIARFDFIRLTGASTKIARLYGRAKRGSR